MVEADGSLQNCSFQQKWFWPPWLSSYGCRQDVGNYQCVDYDDDELQLDPGIPFNSFFVASCPTSFCVCVCRDWLKFFSYTSFRSFRV